LARKVLGTGQESRSDFGPVRMTGEVNSHEQN